MAQLPELIGAPWQVYALAVAGLAIIYQPRQQYRPGCQRETPVGVGYAG